MKPRPWPEELRLHKDPGILEIAFDSGERFKLDAEFLRVHSPSAEVKGHGGRAPAPVSGKEGIRITEMRPIGNYAVRLVFDDGHDTGLYSWDYLHELGQNRARLWKAYLERLDEAGASRRPAFT